MTDEFDARCRVCAAPPIRHKPNKAEIESTAAPGWSRCHYFKPTMTDCPHYTVEITAFLDKVAGAVDDEDYADPMLWKSFLVDSGQ